MQKVVRTAFLVAAVALAGCSQQHSSAVSAAAQQKSQARQASENALKNSLGGGPLTSNAPPLSAYSLSGYKP